MPKIYAWYIQREKGIEIWLILMKSQYTIRKYKTRDNTKTPPKILFTQRLLRTVSLCNYWHPTEHCDQWRIQDFQKEAGGITFFGFSKLLKIGVGANYTNHIQGFILNGVRIHYSTAVGNTSERGIGKNSLKHSCRQCKREGVWGSSPRNILRKWVQNYAILNTSNRL